LTKINKSSPTYRLIIYLLTFSVLAANLNCATTGLVSKKYPEDFYKVPKLLPHQSAQKNFTFIVYGDNQGSWRVQERFLRRYNWTDWKMLIFPFYQLYLVGNGLVGAVNWLRNSPDYGGGDRRAVRDAVYVEAKRSQAAFILNLGDIVGDNGKRPAHWALFLNENKVEHPLLNEVPYLPTIGNHEHANDSPLGFTNYQAVFGYPRFYTIELVDAVIFILDSNYIIDQYQDIDDDVQDQLFEKWFVSGDDSEEPAWLEKQLTAFDKPFKIVAMHHPPITFAIHHRDWTNPSYGRDLISKRKRLLSLLEKYGVDVVLSGHDHLYQHNLLRYGKAQRMHFVITGGGGGPLREIVDAKTESKLQKSFKNEGLDVSALKRKEVHHYCVVETNRNKLIIKAIGVTNDPRKPTRLIEEIVIEKD
jgi:hypothetical protein